VRLNGGIIAPPLLPKRFTADCGARRSAGAPARETTTNAVRAAICFQGQQLKIAIPNVKILERNLRIWTETSKKPLKKRRTLLLVVFQQTTFEQFSRAMTLSCCLLTVLRPVGRTAGRAFTSKANGGSFPSVSRSAETPSKATTFAQPSTESAPNKTNPAPTTFGLDAPPSPSKQFSSFSESNFTQETLNVDVPSKRMVISKSMLSAVSFISALMTRLSLCQCARACAVLVFSTN